MVELSKVSAGVEAATTIKSERIKDFERPHLGADDSGHQEIPAVSNHELTAVNLVAAAVEVQALVNEVANTSLAFVVDEGSDRLVVKVTAVGSEEIVRQFPPEEFLTVAKFIANQQKDTLSEDFLKGILFDQKI